MKYQFVLMNFIGQFNQSEINTETEQENYFKYYREIVHW